MKRFWENSPEWQHAQKLYAEYEAEKLKAESAGRVLLASVLADATATGSPNWQRCCANYKYAWEQEIGAHETWKVAHRNFEASPIGQAYLRWLKDPLARAPEQEAA